MKDATVAIIGGGMGGLAAALALHRVGVTPTVYEAAPVLNEIGAGLTISSNATHALEYCGLGAHLAAHGDTPLQGGLIHYKTGEILAKPQIARDYKANFGAEYYHIHRADLHAGMVEQLQSLNSGAIMLGHAFVDLEQSENSVKVKFSNGTVAIADAVIGADGLRSAVRSSLFDTPEPKFTGQVAFRGLAPSEKAAPFMGAIPAAVTMGPGHTITRYYIRQGKIVNVVCLAKTDVWKDEGWTTPATTQEVLREHDGWHEDAIGLINAVPKDGFYKWALFDRDPLPVWSKGRVTLLGDAAHPMLPFQGMGAAMALEDAVVLARCFGAAENLAEAFSRYEKARVEYANAVLLGSRAMGLWYQTTDPDNFSGFPNPSSLGGPEGSLMAYNPQTVEI